jgi:hypothetical protein
MITMAYVLSVTNVLYLKRSMMFAVRLPMLVWYKTVVELVPRNHIVQEIQQFLLAANVAQVADQISMNVRATRGCPHS